MRAAPGKGRQGGGVPVVVVVGGGGDGGALRGPHLPGSTRRVRVLEEPPLVEASLGGDCQEPAVVVATLPLGRAITVGSLRPPVHGLGSPAVRGRAPLVSGRAVQGASALSTELPIQNGTAGKLSPSQFLRCGGFFPRAVLPQSLEQFGDATFRVGFLDLAATAPLVAAVIWRVLLSRGTLTVIFVPGVMMVGAKLLALVVHVIKPSLVPVPVPISASRSLLLP